MSKLKDIWRKPRGFAIDVLPVLLYVALLFAAGLAPLKSLPGPDVKWIDKVWHLGAFGLLALLLARAVALWRGGWPKAPRDAALVSAGLGGLLEVLQSLTGFRSAEWADMVADTVGALLAYLVLRKLL